MMRTPRLAAAVFSMFAVALVAAPAVADKKKDENKEQKEEKKPEEKKAEKKEEKKAERREERKKEEEAKKEEKKPDEKKAEEKKAEENKIECKATYGATSITVDPGTTLPGAASPMCFARAGSQLGPVVCKAGMTSIIFKSKYGVEAEKPNTLDCRKYVH